MVSVALTDGGREVLARSLDAFRSRVREVFAPLNDEETRQVGLLLEKALGVPML